RHRAPRTEIQARPRPLSDDLRVGETYLTAEEIQGRVAELGAQIAADYAGLDPVLVAPLKGSLFFLADLSRAIRAPHEVDFVELAAYGRAAPGGHERVRLLQDLNGSAEGRQGALRGGGRDTR